MRDADPVFGTIERKRERLDDDFGAIVLFAQMRGDDVLQLLRFDLTQQRSRLIVVEMPEPARNPAFERRL
ncbi:MAG: hypothetical protein ABI478_10250 [Propionivibrio sp.]